MILLYPCDLCPWHKQRWFSSVIHCRKKWRDKEVVNQRYQIKIYTIEPLQIKDSEKALKGLLRAHLVHLHS